MSGSTAVVQRVCAACAEEDEDEERQQVQREAAPGGPASARAVPGIVRETLNCSGRPLDPTSLGFFGARFGRDFSHVRVHTDSQAAASATSIGALAYTAGSNIVFGPGQFAPGTHAGRRLLAHELSHVIQQATGRVPAASQALTLGPTDDPFEREAEAQADRVLSQSQSGSERELRPGCGSAGACVQRAPQKRENGSIVAFAPWHAGQRIASGQLLALTAMKERAVLEQGTLLMIVASANDHLKYHVRVMKTRTEPWGTSPIEGIVTAGWLEDSESVESPKGAVVSDAAATEAPKGGDSGAAGTAPATSNTGVAPGPARTNTLITGLLDESAKPKPKTRVAAKSLVQIIGTDREGNFKPVGDAHYVRIEEPTTGSEVAKGDKGRLNRWNLTRVSLTAPAAAVPAGPDVLGIASAIEGLVADSMTEQIEGAFPTDMAGILEITSLLSEGARHSLTAQFELDSRIGLAVVVVQQTLGDPDAISSLESVDAIRNADPIDRAAIDAFIASGAGPMGDALSTAVAVDAEAIAADPLGTFQARLRSRVIGKLHGNLAFVDQLESQYSNTAPDSPEWRHLREQVAPLIKQDLALIAEIRAAKQARGLLEQGSTWVSQVSQGAHGEGGAGPEENARYALDHVDSRFLVAEGEVDDVSAEAESADPGAGGAGGADAARTRGPDAARCATSLARVNVRIATMEAAHRGFLSEYPMAAALEKSEDVPNLESNSSNAEIMDALRSGFFADFRSAVKDTIADIESGDIDLHTLDLYIDEVKQELGYDQNEVANAAVDEWLTDERQKDENLQLILGGAAIVLTLAAFVVTGGTAAFVIGLLGTAAGMADAAYNFEKAQDTEQLASAGDLGSEMVADRDAARFNYWMAVLGLALSALDIAQLKSAGSAALKGMKKTGPVAGQVAREGVEAGGKRSGSLAATAETPASKVAAVKRELDVETSALAHIDSVEAGHKLWMDTSGAIYRCSPTCTTLWLNYGDVLADDANALLRRDLSDLEKRAVRAAANGSEAEAKRIMLDAHQIEARLKHAAAKKGVTKVPSPEELLEQKGFAHDIGVKHGRAMAQSPAGGNLKSAGFVNPFEHIGSHGQGFDDIMSSGDDLDKADVFIVEYKGGTATLSEGQMELGWVLQNIRRLAIDGGDSGKRWADILMRAFREGRLKGRAFSTELVGASAQPTKVSKEWSYGP